MMCYIKQFRKQCEIFRGDGPQETDAYRLEQASSRPDAQTVQTTVRLTARRPLQGVAFGVDMREDFPAERPFVMVPGAVYDGNRFEVRRMAYAPMYYDKADQRVDIPVLITDIPHMNREGASKLELRAGDGAAPMVALWWKAAGTAMLVYYDPLTDKDEVRSESGFTLCEDEGLSLAVQYPVIRLKSYHFPAISTDLPSEDKPVDLEAGQSLAMTVTRVRFPCATIHDLYEKVLLLRYRFTPRGRAAAGFPLSECRDVITDKYNRLNWNEAHRYYTVGVGDGYCNAFQTGWVGGGISLYAFMRMSREAITVERAERSLDFLFDRVQSPSGLFYGLHDGTAPKGDNFRNHEDASFLLIRKNADVLYFISAALLDRKKRGQAIKPSWLTGIRRCADALLDIWERYGQLGMFVNADTRDILVGGSFSASFAAAGLALYAVLSGEKRYMDAAVAVAQQYYAMFERYGCTFGGPGEALCCADSESAYGLLESFLVVYECGGGDAFLTCARHAADYMATWCMPYDYAFPAASEFARIGVSSTGSVFANCQNKHSAPGVCTHSGSAFLRLYRYTGQEAYLRVMEDIAHGITQYVSHPDRPLYDFQGFPIEAGYMCERVSTCDWEGYNRIGEVFNGSCWCEVSALLTFADVPGVYYDKARDRLAVPDYAEAGVQNGRMRLHNPTAYPMRLQVLVDDGEHRPSWDLREEFREVEIPAGETRELAI